MTEGPGRPAPTCGGVSLVDVAGGDGIDDDLAALAAAGRWRTLREVLRLSGGRVRVDGRELLSLASCDTLGLGGHPALAEAAARAARERGTSAGSARLLAGHDEATADLEEALAAYFGAPSALLFASGYLANLGVLPALAGPHDLVVSDATNHASFVDACRLARATVRIVPRGDVAATRAALADAGAFRRALLLLPGVSSMDGDVAPLAPLADVADEAGALILVDDAHGLGAVGPCGRGSAAAAGVAPGRVLQIGNLGKALGSYGAFVLAESRVRELLLQTSRTFVFTCALPPPVVAAARAALQVLGEEPGRVARLQHNARALRAALAEVGLGARAGAGAGDVEVPVSPIVPVLLGGEERALAVSARLLARGWLAPAVRPPTVPAGTSRLRLVASALHEPGDYGAFAADLAAVVEELPA